ncbi:unnamed protein product [Rhizoctonia solani]|uniref:Uncharacterized protein n=1 Tax=Rhizoctonia solani TaxID=456999 RepID=A0A8H3E4A8_9AGAM|nr:unnamed protein product [Rhizoctonia solani]
MSSIFDMYDYTSAPATITYDDDDKLIDVVLTLGTRGTYTFKIDDNPSGNLNPYAGQVFYKHLDALVERADTSYELRTGGKYAVVTLGDEELPSTAVVVAYSDRIVPKRSDTGTGDWTVAHSKIRPTEPRRKRFTTPSPLRLQVPVSPAVASSIDRSPRPNSGYPDDSN